ncbi:MAG TPA: hemerythrin family protein [Woeseiaceae bacterium]
MSLIQWKKEFSVGNESVDHEHRELIALINELHAAVSTGSEQDLVVEALGEIYAQIAAHFALEEKIMRDAHYDHFAPHKADHEALLDTLADIMEAVETDGRYDERSLSEKMERWFSEHFRTHDARLHRRL